MVKHNLKYLHLMVHFKHTQHTNTHSTYSISVLSTAGIAGAVLQRKPPSAISLAVHLTLLQSTCAKCWPPVSTEISHLMTIFLDKCHRLSQNTGNISPILPFSSCKECKMSYIFSTVNSLNNGVKTDLTKWLEFVSSKQRGHKIPRALTAL
jgi:hypothetical protein